jgi:hemoglobin
MAHIPDELPAGVEAYGRSPDFTPDTMPPQLRSAHSTKAGTWGLLHVLEGAVDYQLESPNEGERTVAAGGTVVIEPEIRHHVAFREPGRFFVEFYRAKAPAG